MKAVRTPGLAFCPWALPGRVLMFNAKEAFHKCQHKITHTLIDFHEVD
jgi:hypothetical protein